jgi:hypothetical protein
LQSWAVAKSKKTKINLLIELLPVQKILLDTEKEAMNDKEMMRA